MQMDLSEELLELPQLRYFVLDRPPRFKARRQAAVQEFVRRLKYGLLPVPVENSKRPTSSESSAQELFKNTTAAGVKRPRSPGSPHLSKSMAQSLKGSSASISSMTEEELTEKIAQLKREKHECFVKFKQLINSSKRLSLPTVISGAASSSSVAAQSQPSSPVATSPVMASTKQPPKPESPIQSAKPAAVVVQPPSSPLRSQALQQAESEESLKSSSSRNPLSRLTVSVPQPPDEAHLESDRESSRLPLSARSNPYPSAGRDGFGPYPFPPTRDYPAYRGEHPRGDYPPSHSASIRDRYDSDYYGPPHRSGPPPPGYRGYGPPPRPGSRPTLAPPSDYRDRYGPPPPLGSSDRHYPGYPPPPPSQPPSDRDRYGGSREYPHYRLDHPRDGRDRPGRYGIPPPHGRSSHGSGSTVSPTNPMPLPGSSSRYSKDRRH